jgi:hypothetical protein
MHKIVLGSVLTTSLFTAVLNHPAAAMTVATLPPAVVGAGGGVEKVAVVCGPYGCTRVRPSYRAYSYAVPYYGSRPYYYGYYGPWGWSDVGRTW